MYKQYSVASGDDHEVTIDFAIYKFATDAVYTDQGDLNNANSCEDSTALIYELVEAANAGVKVRLLYHNPEELVDNDEPVDTIGEYLSSCFSDGPWNDRGMRNDNRRNFHIHRANWHNGRTTGQMHNKFLLASHMLGMDDDADGRVTTNSILVGTANLDSFNRYPNKRYYAQSAILTVEEPGLFNAYQNYFQVLWDYTLASEEVEGEEDCSGPCLFEEFRDFMRSDKRPLNYISGDGKIQAFFYPLPSNEIWDIANNAVSKFVHAMTNENLRQRYMKIDMYHLKGGYFVQSLANHTKNMTLHLRGFYQKDTKHDTTYSTLLNFQDIHDGDYDIRYGNGQVGYSDSEGEEYALSDCSRKTHTKNYLFSYHNTDGIKLYVTVTGSTNGKDDAYNSKANNQLVVVEDKQKSETPIYLSHKDLFYGTFNHCS